MKRFICTLLSLSLLFGSVEPMETVLAENAKTNTKAVAEENTLSVMDRAASLDGTFSTIDGGRVSLKADASKDVTMLVFGSTTCGNCSYVTRNISASEWIHNAKVRVIFAESTNADKKATTTFAKTYGCDKITFCYDLKDDINILMWQYVYGAGLGGSVTFPVIILLDSGNSVRSLTTGYKSSDELSREVNRLLDSVKKPSVPAVKSFEAKAAKKKLTLSWKKVTGAAGYQIQISEKKNFKGAKTISVSKSEKSYTQKKLKAKKKYYVRVRAYKKYKDASGRTQKACGKWKTISKNTK